MLDSTDTAANADPVKPRETKAARGMVPLQLQRRWSFNEQSSLSVNVAADDLTLG